MVTLREVSIRCPQNVLFQTFTDVKGLSLIHIYVVKYDGKYFTLMNLDGYDALVNPMDSDNWGMICNYESSLDTYQFADNEYVVYNDSVYHPVIRPNADEPKKNVNITYNDPRNYNIKRHMVQLALYELHKLELEKNVIEVQLNDVDDTQFMKFSNFVLNELNGVNNMGLMKKFHATIVKARKEKLTVHVLDYP